jgi:6-phosphogluconolactonase
MNHLLRGMLVACLFVSLGCCCKSAAPSKATAMLSIDQPASSYLVYVGTYTKSGKSKGIYVMRLDAASGKLSEPRVAAEMTSPSFVTIHPSEKYVYAIGEGGGKEGGPVVAYSIDASTGKLTKINEQLSGGAGPCFVGVNHAGNVALVANYGGGSFESLPIDPATGKLGAPASFIQDTGSGPDPRRQKEPHSHSLNPTPDDKFALGCDLGLDKIFVWKIDAATAMLTPADPPFVATPPAGGPRHLAFHPNARFCYVCNEMGNSVTAFAYDGKTLTTIGTQPTLPADYKDAGKNTTAEVQVHPSGKWAYVSNRGHNSIAVFTVDQKTGALTPAGHVPSGGKTPRNFRIDPSGTWLLAAHQDSDNVVLFKIDPATGMPAPTGTEVSIGSPVCVKFLPVR